MWLRHWRPYKHWRRRPLLRLKHGYSRTGRFWVGLLVSFSLSTTIKSVAADYRVEGQAVADANRCLECHGSDGYSSDAKIPHHAGQLSAYLVKQLDDFQSGARQHETMTLMAEDLTAGEIAQIAGYFASLGQMQGEAIASLETSKNLFAQGDPARGIKACASCHGDRGKGRVADNVVYPLIGGQRRNYLYAQLVNWKLGERNNSPNGVMNDIAKRLDDAEMEGLANYISGL
ncbi:MAG: c-type cytochrome [Methylococcaceae bacterium]|nr:c-type cytochrome [Methylococcaceae bacterium]